MDKIFKNNTIMGIVAILTLALTAYLFMKVRNSEKPAPKTTTQETPLN